MGFELVDGIYCTLCINNSGLQAIQRYRWSTHTLQFTITHALRFSVFTSRILATDLEQSHTHFKSHIKSSLHSLTDFLPFLLNHLRLPSPELDPVLDNWSVSQSVRVTLRLTVSQSVCLSWCRAPSGAHDQILVTVWHLLSCPWEGALSDERTGLSFVSQSAVLGPLSVYTIFTYYMCHMLLNTYTIYTRRLSVRAKYSRLCPISGSFPITAV
jgi:hypothetical protein